MCMHEHANVVNKHNLIAIRPEPSYYAGINKLQIWQWNNRMSTSIIKELLGTKIAECNEIIAKH